MNNEISLSVLWKVFVKAWKAIVIFMLIAMLLMGVFTDLFISKKYSSSVAFYVINVAEENNYVTTSLMSVVEHLSNDYVQIIKSEKMLSPLSGQLKAEYDIEYTPDQLRQMMSTSVTANTSTFTLKITNTDKNHAYIIAKLIAEEAPDVIREFTSVNRIVEGVENEEEQVETEIETEPEVEKVRVLNHPVVDRKADSPNLLVNVAVAGMLAAVAVYALYFIKSFLNTTITSEEDFADLTEKYPLLGNMPRWE